MSEWYTVGLQAGKNVTAKVNEYVKTNSFTPDRQQTLSDGTTIYEWYFKWNPYVYTDEAEFVSLLQDFDDSDDPNDAYKCVCIGDEGSEDEYVNKGGFEFTELYRVHKIVYPETWDSDKETKELPACIIDVFEDFLTQKNVSIPNDEHEGDEGEAIIYGSDFDEMMDKITETLKNFGIPVKDSWS